MAKNTEKNLVNESTLPTSDLSGRDKQGSIFERRVLPKLSSIINTSSGIVSNLIGLAGGFWDKKEEHDQEKVEASVSSSRYSSSLIFDESPDILIVSRQKVYGRRERFSQEFGINLKKLRNGRFSEYTPHRNLALHIDSDVQPQIVTLREAHLEQRKRTESCYPRIGCQTSTQDQLSVSIRRENEESLPPDYQSTSRVSDNNLQPFLSNEEHKIVFNESLDLSQNEICKTHDFERSGLVEEEEIRLSVSCGEEFYTEKKKSLALNRVRSIDSVSVSINGKIFKYFDKSQLCSVPVVNFNEFWEKVKGLKVKMGRPWYSPALCEKICCFGKPKLDVNEMAELEKIIFLSIDEFEFDNELHLMLLLGTYILVTGEKDWPSHDKDWLKLGFSSIDLKLELARGGLIGLIFMFFLADHFSSFLSEILKVSIYYSFEVFQVLKQIAFDAVFILRSQKLNGCLNEKGKSVERFFLFTCGMLKKWFKLIVSNKDFEEMRKAVVEQGRSVPQEFIVIAQNMEL